MKHPLWSTIIVASFGLGVALITGFGPRVMPDISHNFYLARSRNAAPAPTIQMERPRDTQKRFVVRLCAGTFAGILIGLASRKSIIRKFEEDFTPW